MHIIFITEEQYKHVLKTLAKGTKHIKPDNDGVQECVFWLDKADCGVDSFEFGVIEGCITDRNLFPIVFIRKYNNVGYAKVGYDPELVGCEFLDENERNYVSTFVCDNVESLYLIAHGDQFVIDTRFKYISPKEREMIDEAPQLSVDLTGLKTRLWVDNDSSYKMGRHGKRLKFQKSSSTKSDGYATMTISDNPEVKGNLKGSSLDSKDLKKIEDFIAYNKEILSDLADKKINFYTDFIPHMVTFSKKGKPLFRFTNREYTIVKNTSSYGFLIVKSNDGLFNYVDEGNHLISDVWFDTAIPFKQYGSLICGRVSIWKYWYNIYPNGTLTFLSRN